MKSFLVNLGLLFFLLFSASILGIYLGFLFEKTAFPGYGKFIAPGFVSLVPLVMMVFIVADFFILRRFMRRFRKGWSRFIRRAAIRP